MARLLALDVGERRIGVAICDPTGTVARPLTFVVRASRQADFETIARLVAENEVERVIVGLPLSLDGSEGPQARQTRRYAERLAQALTVPIEFWDERYSTLAAAEILKGKSKRGGRKRRGRARGELDATAAAVFLQSYLDARASSELGVYERDGTE
jgi:putative Holliday junction resolvase